MINKVRILGIDYKIIYEDSERSGMSDIGQCHTTQCLIRLCSNKNSKEHAKCVLIHEIIEAINYRLELKLDHNIITSLESSLFAVLIDNPDLLRLLLKK